MKRKPIAVTLMAAVLLAGCGGSSPQTARTTASTTTTSTTSASTTTRSHTPSTPTASGPLAFARCMRTHGVPNFPDPVDGRITLPGDPTTSPALRSAMARCQRYMGTLPALPGSTTHPSPQTMRKLVRIASCMRRHGVPQFPDPRTTVPTNPAGKYQEITDFDNAILLFPTSMNLQAPAYRQALGACGAPPLGLPH